MPTRRTPLNRERLNNVPPQAPDIFEKMLALKNWEDDEKWWPLHSQLHELLHRKPWQWPCIFPPDEEIGFTQPHNYEAGRALYDELRRHVEARHGE